MFYAVMPTILGLGAKLIRYNLSVRFSAAVLAAVMIWIVSPIDAVAAERMAVKSDIANIRSGPSAKSELLWQIEKYHPVLVIEKKGQWYLFKDFEGDQGWVHASLLDKTPTVIVKVRRCNVRSGPDAKYDVVFTVDKGIPFKVLEVKGRWIKVQHADGDKGWIFKSLVW